jgi:capsular exopolysaccharide synthesis family protein
MGYVFDAISQDDDRSGRKPADAMPAMAPRLDEPTLRLGGPSVHEHEPAEPTAELTPAQLARLDERLVALTEPQGLMAEEYRAIRTGLLARWQNKKHLVHTITSATPQEGKTITSLNLGLILAELRMRRTVVVEMDLRLPQFGRLLNLPETPGLVAVLEGDAPLNEAIHRVQGSRLDVIAAGRRANDRAVQLLSSSTAAELINTLRQRYDHVVIDTPPVIELADAGIVGALSDDVVLIARMNRTPRPLIEQAIKILTSYNAPVAGLIGTDNRAPRRRYLYRYGYSYGYGYSYRYRRGSKAA